MALQSRPGAQLHQQRAPARPAVRRSLQSSCPRPAAPQRLWGHTAAPRKHVIVCAAAQKVSQLPASLQKIVGAFQMVPDPMARYKQLLFFATKLEKLPDELHTPENKVEGCVSQVWVVPELRADGKVYWRADSDSQLTKGLAALLVNGLSGCTPEEIVRVQPDFIEALGLKQSLTPSRNNGFLNMLKLMQRKALALATASAAAAAAAPATASNQEAAAPSTSSSSNGNASASRTPVQDGIRRKLTEALRPTRLVVEDQSAQHAGHAHMMSSGAGKAGSGETHFRVEVVSEAFEGKSLVQRQRWIYQLLSEEFGLGLHALSLDTKTPAEHN